MRYLVVYEQEGDAFGAYVPDLPGCVATGKSLDEVRGRIREAVQLHIEAMRKDGDPIPEPSSQSEYLELAG